MTETTTRYARCPRCDRETLRADRPALNALSRIDNDTYICSPCGSDEAARDLGGLAPIPPDEWPIDVDDDPPAIEEGTTVVLLTSNPEYRLGAMSHPGSTRFDAEIAPGTRGIYRGHWDSLTPDGSPQMGTAWHAVEVEVDGETLYVPVGDSQMEPIEE